MYNIYNYIYTCKILSYTNYVRNNNIFSYHGCCWCSIDFIITDLMVSTMQKYRK